MDAFEGTTLSVIIVVCVSVIIVVCLRSLTGAKGAHSGLFLQRFVCRRLCEMLRSWVGRSMDVFRGTALSVISVVCLSLITVVCLMSLTPAVVAAFLSLLVLWGGSLALGVCLSDPRVALVRSSGVIGVSAATVLYGKGGGAFSAELTGTSDFPDVSRLQDSLLMDKPTGCGTISARSDSQVMLEPSERCAMCVPSPPSPAYPKSPLKSLLGSLWSVPHTSAHPIPRGLLHRCSARTFCSAPAAQW